MGFHETIKTTLRENKKQIDLFRMSVMDGIAALIYPKYLMKLKRKDDRSNIVLCPSIKSVEDFLAPTSPFMEYLSSVLIGTMIKNPMFLKYCNAKDFDKLFFNEDDKDKDIISTVYDLYIADDISKHIPVAIKRKFGFINPDMNNNFVEDNDTPLFDTLGDYREDDIRFVIYETIMNMLILSDSVVKEFITPPTNRNIPMLKDDIMTISCESALTPIHINESIINIARINSYLPFILNTEFIPTTDEEGWNVNSGPFNSLAIVRLKGVKG